MNHFLQQSGEIKNNENIYITKYPKESLLDLELVWTVDTPQYLVKTHTLACVAITCCTHDQLSKNIHPSIG